MKRFTIGDQAPDFSLPDHSGALVSLSEVIRYKQALLVFNIGFA